MGLVVGRSPLARARAWAQEELAGLDLGDRRRNARLVEFVARSSLRPAASMPEICEDWATIKATYGLLHQEAVTPDAILAPHMQRTRQRAAQQPLVLALQDTMSLDYTHHPATHGLGPLSHPSLRGVWVHSSLVATPEGVPLGLVHQASWTRDAQAVGQKHTRRERATAAKESQKWLTGLEQTMERLPGQRVVVVADAEGDLYDYVAAPRQEGTEVLVRAAQDRRVRGEAGRLWAAVEAEPVWDTWEVSLHRREDKPGRTARVTGRARRVEVEPPVSRGRRRDLPPVLLWAVLVREEAPPAGEPPLEWLLLTSVPVETKAAVRERAAWYRQRWLIERYHYVLKSGCRVEDLQLEHADRLQRAVAAYGVVAWRLLWLTYEARRHPEQACAAVLAREEWEVLYCAVHQTSQPPAEPPPLGDVVRWLARLGGFLGRTGDGDPGPKTIWRGWRRLEDMLLGRSLHLQRSG